MSEHELPFHIQEEIMKRLPVKSLIQFRCVSKPWKSLIDSSEFIYAHSLLRHTNQQHLLVSYDEPLKKENYVCFDDDDTFPQQRSPLTLPTLPRSVEYYRHLGSSHGLLCLYQHHPSFTFTAQVVIIWNPFIRKSIVVTMPKQQPCIGFGVCPVTLDPKIVSFKQSWDESDIGTSYRCRVMVYTLSSGKWKSLSNNLPTKPIREPSSMVVTDRFNYWRSGLTHNMITSFDLSNESFELIDLPDTLARHDSRYLCMSKLRNSLAMLQKRENVFTVWMMEHGVERSFTKLFIIDTPHHIVGFRNSGVPVMRVYDDDDDDDAQYKLVVYEPNSEHENVAKISGFPLFLRVQSYMETLLLLGRSDCNSY